MQEEWDDAVAMMTECAAQGHMKAQSLLASIYRGGLGVTEDQYKARDLHTKAAAQGDALSQSALACHFRDGTAGSPQSWSEAAVWFTKAADQGDALSQCELARIYMTGQGRPIDYSRAVELMELSAAQGHGHSYQGLMALAMLYKEGLHGTKPRWAEALRLMELAVKGGRLGPTGTEELLKLVGDIRECSPLLRQRVVVRSSNAEFDGACGVAIDFGFEREEGGEWLIDSGRYTVKLDGSEGRLVKVRVGNAAKEEGGQEGE